MAQRILVDIETAAGAKYGSGPLTTVTDWQQVARLNRAGSFNFRMPASDARSGHCRPKRYARCWHFGPDGKMQMGYGRIERVEIRDTTAGPMCEVSGVDLLGTLTDRLMRRESLREETNEHPTHVANANASSMMYAVDKDPGDTTTYASVAANCTDITISSIYKFHRIKFILGPNVNDRLDGFGYEHSTSSGWTGITNYADGTTQLSQSGWFTIGIDSNTWSAWEPATGEIVYKVKISRSVGGFNAIDFKDISIDFYGPTNDALYQIMYFAPYTTVPRDLWSYDTTLGYDELQYRPLSGTELVTNGDFEDVTGTVDDSNEDAWTDWTVDHIGSDGAKALAVSGGHSGNCVKLLTGTTGGSGDYVFIYQQVAVTANTEYTLRFWGKGDGTNALQMRLFHNATPWQYMSQLIYTTSAAVWTETRHTFTTPTGVTSISVVFVSPDPANSYAFVDDVSLQAGGGNTIYLQCSDETVLDELVRVSEVTGENFIMSPTEHKVLWLGNDENVAPVRAVSNVDPIEAAGEDSIAIITEISELEDTSEVVSRVYPYGSGMGANRVTLASITAAPPTGYTVDTTNGYVQRTAAVSTLGIIETTKSWSDIVQQSDDTTAAAQSAANILMIQAANWLEIHSCTSTTRLTGDIPRFYTLAIAKCAQLIYPGYKIRTTHHRWVDGFHVLSIDADLWITAATWRVGINGANTVGLEVATVPRTAVNDALALATGIRKIVGTVAHNSANGY